MTDVAFHFGAVDKVAYTTRLLRKASASGARVLLLANAALVEAVDQALWTVSPTDFVDHASHQAPSTVRRRSAVWLDTSVPEVDELPTVCVNAGQPVPQHWQRFERLIEVVSLDEEDRQGARERWRFYTSCGVPITRHDLALQAEAP